MTIPVSRESGQAVQFPERLRLKAIQTAEAGGIEERFARRRSRVTAKQHKRRNSTIRAWHAPDAEAARTPKQVAQDARRVDAEAVRPPFALENGGGSRQSAARRAARMRAVEEAFRNELRRQLAAEAEDQRRPERTAKR